MPETGGAFLFSFPSGLFTPEDFNEQHQLVAQTAEAFALQEVLPRSEAIEHQDFAVTRDLLNQAAQLGLTSVDVPETYGGQEMDFISSAIVADHIAKQGSFSVSFSAHVGIGTLPILYFGTEEQKRRYLPRLASGEWVGAYALSESSSGSDAMAIHARADLSADGRHWRLNGEKMWITNGGFADLFTVFAKVSGEQFTCFLVERSFPGVETGAEEKKLGIKGSSTRPLILRDAEVPVENVLGEIGKGHVIAFNILNVGRFKLGAACVGGARRVLQEMLGYVGQRQAFGKPLTAFPLVQQMIADTVLGIYGCESAVYRTVGMIAARLEGIRHDSLDAALQIRRALEEFAVECSIIKVQGSEMLDRAVDTNVQAHGGFGFVQEYSAERAYRDSRVNRIFEGTNEINRLLITGMLLRRVQKGELPLMKAIQQVSNEVLAAPAPLPEDNAPVQVENARKLCLLLAGAAFQKYQEKLSDEQEVLAGLSDLLIEVYVLQSALARARKQQDGWRPDPAAWPLPEMLAQVIVSEGLDRIELIARRISAAVTDGDALRTQMAVLRRLLKRDPLDVISLRRRIAQAAIAAGRYPV